jgi:hypothetical protein
VHTPVREVIRHRRDDARHVRCVLLHRHEAASVHCTSNERQHIAKATIPHGRALRRKQLRKEWWHVIASLRWYEYGSKGCAGLLLHSAKNW